MKNFIFILLMNMGIAHAANYDPQDLSNAYIYLNQLRIGAGMTGFSTNSQLEQSAFNHANYLANNFLIGHYESTGTGDFTGIELTDRVKFTGYHSTLVSENVSSGDDNNKDAIDNLMSAIYHRFGFLNFVKNEIGIGIGQVSTPNFHSAYVFNMGNSEYNALCQGPDFTDFGSYIYGVCEPDIRIEKADFNAVAIRAQGNNPYFVKWPIDGDDDVPPAFFEESPDPLPDYSVSGYPVSIQFNPLTFTTVDVTQFKIYREIDNQEIQPTRLLTAATDPNAKFSVLDYALFPLERLDWNTAYRVELEYVANSNTNNLIWNFTTKDLGVPLYTVQGIGEEILLPVNNEMFAFYVPPTFEFPDLGGGLKYSYNSGMSIATEFEDGNTVLVSLVGTIGQQATFKFAGERYFTVKISAAVTAENNTDVGISGNGNVSSSEIVTTQTSVNDCEPVTISANGRMHIPALTYTPAVGASPLILQADLAFVNNLALQIIYYEPTDATVCANTVTLSPELKMHITNLHFTPFVNDETPWRLRADLEYHNDLFVLVNIGFN